MGPSGSNMENRELDSNAFCPTDASAIRVPALHELPGLILVTHHQGNLPVTTTTLLDAHANSPNTRVPTCPHTRANVLTRRQSHVLLD
jgi:hypothetical protein